MSIESLQEEYDLSLDDIRWFLASRLTDSLLSQRETPQEITRRIWSGALEGELYDLEERYLRDLRDQLDRDLIDERHVREDFERARMLKMRRR